MIFLDKLKSLSPFVQSVALQKATELPFSGRFLKPQANGTYLCRRCGIPLWQAVSQFESHCGWPSFDERNPISILEIPDKDSVRTEIICNSCQSHLGHVFRGEGFTSKNQRDCVNSVMLDFITSNQSSITEEVIIAGGCFWGIEYWLQKQPGVLFTECGYIGGHIENPDYTKVCQGDSGHLEAVRVIFDPLKTHSSNLYRYFFEIHDPTQAFGQGPDIGPQYQSAIFYYDDLQKSAAEELILQLQQKGLNVRTKLLPMQVFWTAELYHQNYYQTNKGLPYCHLPTKRF